MLYHIIAVNGLGYAQHPSKLLMSILIVVVDSSPLCNFPMLLEADVIMV